MSLARRTRRSAGLTALAAVAGAVVLAVAPTASAASAATATLTANVPIQARGAGTSVVSFGSLQIDDGTTITCISAQEGTISGVSPRVVFGTSYKITAGTTYGISAWEGSKCDWYDAQTDDWMQSLGGVTVTPTAADVASGVYQVTIP
ncbi:hypothetical protein OK074_4935 [Actinobacteria bacterium OK074]|nr:hypothetical protein OK074_4935 [Actinobacteria bacterium OK074]